MVMNVIDALSAYRQSGGAGQSLGSAAAPAAGKGESFGDVLKDFAGDTVQALKDGEKATADAATGKADLASVVTAISNAELMLQTAITIRDKVIAAYQDITKTSI